MPKLPYLPFYPADWIVGTRVLTDEQKAILIDLLSFMWLNDGERGTLEGHWNDLARMVGRDRLALQTSVNILGNVGAIEVRLEEKIGQESYVKLTSRRAVNHAKTLKMAATRQFSYKSSNALSNALSNAVSNASNDGKVTRKNQKSEVRSQIEERREEEESALAPVPAKREPGSHAMILPSPDKPKDPDPLGLVTLWNQLAHPNLPRVRLLPDRRKRSIVNRLKEFPEQNFWVELVNRVNKSKLLRGENDRGWRCDFDWILNPNNLAKIIEGNYDR